jgi:ADP-heptose:LPS heptosyltransferase
VILVLRALGVGDLVTAVPALRALRTAHPGRTLALAAPTWLTPLIDLIGGVDRVVPLDGLQGGVPDLSGIQPSGIQLSGTDVAGIDLAVNLHGRGPQSHRLLAAMHPRRLWAFANVDAGHLEGPTWTEEEHEVTRWCRMVRFFGVPVDDSDLQLAVPPPADVPYGATIVHPGAKSPTRRWPVDRFAAVAKELTARGHHVVVTGSAGERDAAALLARSAGLPDSAVLAGRTGLGDLAALVAHARLLISGDTGIGHLATAYRTPSVLLFGPVPPRRWGPPPGVAFHRAIWHGTRVDPGDAPGPDPHPALLAVGTDEVLAAADEVERARHAVAAQ